MERIFDVWRAAASSDLVTPLAASLVTGLAIGLERELRAKDAGLRTHALVCLASAVLMLAAARQGEWNLDLIDGSRIVLDPTRMAHGVLTGVGFLGAGVIFRSGASVHGLTTAASLWMTAAIGVVYGTGMIGLGVAATVASLAVLAVLSAAGRVIPRPIEAALRVELAPDSPCDAADMRRRIRAQGYALSATAERRARDGRVRLDASVRLRSAAEGDRLAGYLRGEAGVEGYRIAPRDAPGGASEGWE